MHDLWIKGRTPVLSQQHASNVVAHAFPFHRSSFSCLFRWMGRRSAQLRMLPPDVSMINYLNNYCQGGGHFTRRFCQLVTLSFGYLISLRNPWDEQANPVEILLAIAPIATLIPPDRLKQPDAFIVAQGINREPCSFCDLLDGQFCFHITSIQPGVRSRARVSPSFLPGTFLLRWKSLTW